MKTKFFTIAFSVCLLSLNSISQTVRDKIEKQAKDPITKENAAKADVYVQKKIIFDTVTLKKKGTVIVKDQHKVLIYKKKKRKSTFKRKYK